MSNPDIIIKYTCDRKWILKYIEPQLAKFLNLIDYNKNIPDQDYKLPDHLSIVYLTINDKTYYNKMSTKELKKYKIKESKFNTSSPYIQISHSITSYTTDPFDLTIGKLIFYSKISINDDNTKFRDSDKCLISKLDLEQTLNSIDMVYLNQRMNKLDDQLNHIYTRKEVAKEMIKTLDEMHNLNMLK